MNTYHIILITLSFSGFLIRFFKDIFKYKKDKYITNKYSIEKLINIAASNDFVVTQDYIYDLLLKRRTEIRISFHNRLLNNVLKDNLFITSRRYINTNRAIRESLSKHDRFKNYITSI